MKRRVLAMVLAGVLVLAGVPGVKTQGYANTAVRPASTIAAASFINDIPIVHYPIGFSLAIKTDGSLWGWGSVFYENKDSSTHLPVPVKITDQVKAVAANWCTVYIIKNDNSLWGWGDGSYYGILLSTAIDKHTDATYYRDYKKPVKIMDDVAYVSTGFTHTMAIKTDGSLWGWGTNHAYQIGNGAISPGVDMFPEHVYKPVKIMDDVVSVTASSNATMAIKKDGTLWGWGFIYDGTNNEYNLPVKIMDSVSDVAFYEYPSDGYTLIVKTDNSLWVRKNSRENTTEFTYVMDSVAAVSVGSQDKYWGDRKVYAITTSGDLFVFESSDFSSYTIATGQVVSVTACDSHTIAVKTDGSLWIWGNNDCGQIGDGTINYFEIDNRPEDRVFFEVIEYIDNNRLTPVKIMDDVLLPGSSPITPAPPPPAPLSSASGWAVPGIEAALGKGFVPAEIQSNYKSPITRAEFCRMAVRYIEYRTGKDIDTVLREKNVQRQSVITLTDTTDPDILAAVALGIVTGYSDGTFRPNNNLSRAEAATMLTSVCSVLGIDIYNPPPAGFTDVPATHWANTFINFCAANGIMSGTGTNRFSPSDTYTREQAIITFNNIK